VTANDGGQWTLTPGTNLAEGEYTFTASVVNAAGNTDSTTFKLTIDTTAPDAPKIDTVIDDVGGNQGPLTSGDTTDDTTPTFIGKDGEPGSTIIIYDGDGGIVGSSVVDKNGDWTITTNPLPEGPHDLTLTATDEAGNESTKTDFTVIVDTVGPTKSAIITSIEDDNGSDPHDFITNDDTLIIWAQVSEPLIQGEFVQISVDNGVTWQRAVLDQASGKYALDLTSTPFADGTYTFVSRVVDTAGNPGPASAQIVVIDLTPPTDNNAVAITAYTDDIGAFTGDFASGTSTDDTTPLLKGTVSGLEPGDYVVVKVAAGSGQPTTLGVAVVSADGTWVYQVLDSQALPEGDYTFTAIITDKAGNEGTVSNNFALTVDLTAPRPVDPTKMDLWDDVGNVTGTIDNLRLDPNGDPTDDTRPTYSGSAGSVDPNDVVAINVYDNGKLIGSAAVQADGSWSFEPRVPIDPGSHSFQAAAVDAAGLEGQKTPSWDFKILGDAPSAPAITLVYDDFGPVTGSLQKGQTTDDTTPTISGTGTAGTTVTIYVDGVAKGAATVANDGTWSVTVAPPLSGDGIKNITAKATDAAGQDSPETGVYPIFLDTTAPSKPAVPGAWDDQGPVTGPIKPGDTTDDTTPTLSGTGDPGDTVIIKDGTDIIGSSTVDKDGNWTWTPTDPLEEGSHSVTTEVTDPAGNTSPPSNPLEFEVDSSDVIVSITKAIDDYGKVKGDVANKGITDDQTPTLVGKGTPGATVAIYDTASPSVAIGSALIKADGSWSVDLNTQSEGTHTYKAVATNAAGTTGEASFTLTIDITPPQTPGLDAVIDDVGIIQGPVDPGGVTDDTTPTFEGSGATPGDVITIYDNGQEHGSVVVDPDGTWTYTPTSPLEEGEHDITITATDPAGNESGESPPFNVTVDTTPPAPLDESAIILYDDVGDITGTIPKGGYTDDTKPEYSGVADPSEVPYVEIFVDGTSVGTVAVEPDGTWSWTPETDLSEGDHEFHARPIDEAGNPGDTTTPYVVT
ncbi:Ig-like domain-containing protein, partial [Desulfosarcina sp. OttesenSCG-928-A07]|nr:Ig-like domain-containing protein [Desulfosarcina sp. OttesenSCG-928-A07]